MKEWIRSLLGTGTLALVFGLGGCTGICQDSDPCALERQPRTVAITLPSAAVEAVPGASVAVPVVVNYVRLSDAALSIVSPLPAGVTATLDPASVSGAQLSTLTISVGAMAVPGDFPIVVRATSTFSHGGSEHVRTSEGPVQVVVPRPFRLQAPSAQQVPAGASGNAILPIVRTQGFTQPVTLSVDPATLPPGATWAFVPSAATTASSAALRIDVPFTTPAGRWRVKAQGAYGATVESVEWDLVVTPLPPPNDFSLSVSPATATVTPGAAAQYTVTIGRTGPGLGDVQLSATGLPAGASATFTPPVAGGATAQLQVTTSSATPDGTWSIVVTGTSGSLNRQATVTLVVNTPADFALAVNPATLRIDRGAAAQAVVNIQRTGNPGTVTLAAPTVVAGITTAVAPAATVGTGAVVSVSVGASVPAGSYPITITGTAGALTRSTTLTVVVPAPPVSQVTLSLLAPSVTVAPGGLVTIPVRLTRTGTAIGQRLELRVTGLPAGGVAWVAPSFTTGDTATLQIVGGPVGSSTVTVSAMVGSVPPSASATVNVVASSTPDFSVVPAQTTLAITRGGPFTPVTVNIRRVAGFSGAVELSAVTDQPFAYAVNFTPSSTTGSDVFMEVYVSTEVPVGAHVIIVRGTGGGLVRTALITVVAQ